MYNKINNYVWGLAIMENNNMENNGNVNNGNVDYSNVNNDIGAMSR